MTKEASTSGQTEANENDFETPLNLVHFPLLRTPLNTIADPAQCGERFYDSEFEYCSMFEAVRAGRCSLLSDRKPEASGNVGLNYGTPGVLCRSGKAHSEPSAAQSTPAASLRNFPRVSCHGSSRVPHHTGGKAAASSRTCRAISIVNSQLPADLPPHFELVEDASFWAHHNVQVFAQYFSLSNALFMPSSLINMRL